jgi:hydroxypyruvate reductase
VSAALAAVDARGLTRRALAALRDEFDRVERVRIVAAGKAADGMARAAAEVLGARLVAGVMTSAHSVADSIHAFPSSHPLPDAASEAAGRAALALAADVRDHGDLLLVCLSGGASAMLCVPAAGLTLEDKRRANELLLRAGLDIGSMNIVRRHLSAIKGGQLAAAAARSITLAISDVIKPIEDDPVTIGSGPTVGDTTTFDDALSVIERAGLRERMPRSVIRHLEDGAVGKASGPVAPDDPRLRDSAYWIAGSRHDAMSGAADTARRIGYDVQVIDAPVDGEARHAGETLLARARDVSRPRCIIQSGETTVRVIGAGRGGRNQELALAALGGVAELQPAALASIGTDGIDGPTDAAGAIVTSEMRPTLGPDAAARCAAALERNDAYPLLERLGALVKTGPTGTNVGDLQVLLLG